MKILKNLLKHIIYCRKKKRVLIGELHNVINERSLKHLLYFLILFHATKSAYNYWIKSSRMIT